MNVLVVDDVGYMRHFLLRLLEQHGHRVVTASSGTVGLQMLERDTSINAVICDLLMPDIDGIEFFRRAQLIERVTDQGTVPPPPIILLTALRPDDTSRNSEVGLLRKATEMGFAEVMLKPVDQKLLIQKLVEFESSDSESTSSAAELQELQNSIQSLQIVVDSTKDSSNKDALLATLQTLKTQLADMSSESEGNDADVQEASPVESA